MTVANLAFLWAGFCFGFAFLFIIVSVRDWLRERQEQENARELEKLRPAPPQIIGASTAGTLSFSTGPEYQVTWVSGNQTEDADEWPDEI